VITREIIARAEEWAVENQYVLRWYHCWLDGDTPKVTAFAQDQRGGDQCKTFEAKP
jgi:hypothetical protein